MDLKETGWEDTNWIYVSGERLVAGSCEHNNESLHSITCWEFHEWLSNWWLLNNSFPLSSLRMANYTKL
jgi:hypothetical protein